MSEWLNNLLWRAVCLLVPTAIRHEFMYRQAFSEGSKRTGSEGERLFSVIPHANVRVDINGEDRPRFMMAYVDSLVAYSDKDANTFTLTVTKR